MSTKSDSKENALSFFPFLSTVLGHVVTLRTSCFIPDFFFFPHLSDTNFLLFPEFLHLIKAHNIIQQDLCVQSWHFFDSTIQTVFTDIRFYCFSSSVLNAMHSWLSHAPHTPGRPSPFFFSISVCCCSQYSPCCPCISLGVLISHTLSCHPLSFCFLPHSSPEVIPVLIFEANIFSAFKRLQCYG